MPDQAFAIVDVAGADATAGLWHTRCGLRSGAGKATAGVLEVGRGKMPVGGEKPAVRVHGMGDWAPVGSWALRRALARLGLGPHRNPAVLHAWSERAARWCGPLAGPKVGVVISVDEGTDLGRTITWPVHGTMAQMPHYACSSEVVRRRLRKRGVPGEHVHVMPAAWPLEGGNHVTREQARAVLGLSNSERAVLVLGPITRASGAFVAAWGTLLVAQLREDVRLWIPESGREAQRALRLAESCGRGWMVRIGVALDESLAAADVGVALGGVDWPVGGVRRAVEAGLPVVAAPTPSLRPESPVKDRRYQEMRGEEPFNGIHWCWPRTPEQVARRLLDVLDGNRGQRLEPGRPVKLGNVEEATAAYGELYARCLGG